MKQKKRFKPLEWLEDKLRYACGSLSKDARILITIIMVLGLSALSIYFSLYSIYSFGKGKGERIGIKHIEHLRFELEDKKTKLDSINNSNKYDYERHEQSVGEFGE